MAEISIIVPVYNVEKYIRRCVDSILAQSFVDFELILIDDGSTDGSGDICDEYSKQDTRVTVVHQTNQGQSRARNVALDLIEKMNNCNWISFIDSDDYVHPKMLEYLFKLAQLTQSEIVSFNHIEGSEDNYKWNSLESKFKVLNGKDFVKHCVYNDDDRGWVLYDNLYQKKCFENIRLPVDRIHEDNATVYKVMYNIESICVTDSILYYYYKNPNSTMNSVYSEENFDLKSLDWLLVLEEMILFFSEQNDRDLLKWADNGYLLSLQNSYNAIRKHLRNSKYEKILLNKLKKQYKRMNLSFFTEVKTNPSLEEIIHPNLSKLYWTVIGAKHKIIKTGNKEHE